MLAEHARRNRHTDNEALLAAIERIEARLTADAFAAQRLRDDLRMLLIAIRLTRPESDAVSPVAQAGKLKRLLDLLQSRLEAMAGDEPAGAAVESTALTAPAEPTRLHLAVVPAPDEPELPIPSPATQTPSIAIVPSAAMMPEVNFAAPRPAAPPVPPPAPEVVTPAAFAPQVATPAAQPADMAARLARRHHRQPRPPLRLRAPAAAATAAAESPLRGDPLAGIMALSEEERLALFT